MTTTPWFKMAFRFLLREAKKGELNLILASILLAVASVFSLTLFSEKVRLALVEQSSQFLAADRVLSSSRPIPDSLKAETQFKLTHSEQIRFSSMIYFDGELKLASIKAIDDLYPLKGDVLLADTVFSEPFSTRDKLKPGEVWLEAKLFQQLNLSLGDIVEIGDSEFIASRILAASPDKTLSVFGQSPEVLMHVTDVPSTNIIQPGSRVNYRDYIAGTSDELNRYYDWLKPQLNVDQFSWYTVEEDNSPVGASLARAQRYFLLASLLSVVLAATAIGVAAKRYAQRHYDLVAILKTFGAQSQQIKKIFITQASLILVVGILAGLLVGLIAQAGVFYFLADVLPNNLPETSAKPWILAIATGLLCGGFFLMLPLFRLFTIPPLRILRQQLSGQKLKMFVQVSSTALVIWGLMWLYSQDFKLACILFVSSAGTAAVLYVIALAGLKLLRRLSFVKGGALKLAIARLHQRSQANSFALVAFTLAIQLMLIALLLKGDLFEQWLAQLKPGTPNYFVANLAHHQKDDFAEQFKTKGVELGDLYPIYRSRLVSVNNETLQDKLLDDSQQTKEEEEQRSAIGRELNLTSTLILPKENTIVEGQWFSEDNDLPLASIEEKLAKRMNIKLGDTLAFDFSGQVYLARVSSIRKVNWQTFNANFFIIVSPQVFSNIPTSYIASFHLPIDKQAELNQVMQQYPSARIIDVRAMLEQVRTISQQAALAVEFIFYLVILAASLVLATQIQASLAERAKEFHVLTCLGAKSKVIKRSTIFEFALLGALAGLFATASSELALWALQTHVLQMTWSWHLAYWLYTPIISAVLLAILGYLSCRGLVNQNYHQRVATAS
ncbi:FtsX-like permease family protein [Catenovulum sp. SM1970]|uniref:ABC transporter permease n=1 Tax=Marinifaba aquimaris TaxID=2741323 RepID=UPI0015736F8A|nr:FtsX-like permease family protein [Marinifaba aquimaris]NTS78076.1 FtsX-like permease family protein [Marinifaba aquimaris]